MKVVQLSPPCKQHTWLCKPMYIKLHFFIREIKLLVKEKSQITKSVNQMQSIVSVFETQVKVEAKTYTYDKKSCGYLYKCTILYFH